MSEKFALLGAAGYIAPRHMKAIKENDCELSVALDPSDSVGIIDSYFPDAKFFTEVERFDRYIDKLRYSKDKIDYFSICTPNYLHDSHIRLALRNDANAICEKPLVINPDNLAFLKKLEEETQKKIFIILQLRHHPSLVELKRQINNNKKHHVKLEYITSRGNWYDYSWKGNESKSGGLASNIGIHFFDMLTWLFGDAIENIVTQKDSKTVRGLLELEHASVEWMLSIDRNNLPAGVVAAGKSAYRNIEIDKRCLEFSNNFTDLHNISYKKVLEGKGFRIADAEPSIRIVNEIMKNGVI